MLKSNYPASIPETPYRRNTGPVTRPVFTGLIQKLLSGTGRVIGCGRPVIAARLLAVLCCVMVVFSSCVEEKKMPFYDDIQAFLKADEDSFPPRNAILFVGSSSFTLWKDVASYFPDHTIINRGFGGSGLNDLVRYADKIILPYKPKQVVIYCGENDIAAGSVTATDVLQRFTELFNIIRNRLPETHIVFVSIKPSPSRQRFMPVMEEANIMIRQLLSAYHETAYVDVYHAMLDEHDEPRRELFIEDNLHMNENGYMIWKEKIEPHLLD